jgi:hypothetical protein
MTLQQAIRLRDSLIEARLGGIREVRDQNGETVTYKSDSEMAAALNFAERTIAQLQGQPVKTIVFSTSKGL